MKCQSISTRLYTTTYQKTPIFILATVRTQNLIFTTYVKKKMVQQNHKLSMCSLFPFNGGLNITQTAFGKLCFLTATNMITQTVK
jgi:hypothetical protein